MAKQYFVVVGDNGEEISRSECVEQKGVFGTLKDKFSKFGTEHPKIAKGLKIGAGIAAIGGAIAVGVAVAKNGDNSDEYERLPDNTADSLPDYSEPESDTYAEETDANEAPETTE